MTVNDGGAPDPRRYEELRLIRAFLRLTNPGRQRILDLVERLAEDAEFAVAAPAFVATDASVPEPIGDFAGPTE
ncbi:hypothetical protein TSA1_36615 [Bradyrhizobium nitroreducens]|uniref:Uncharacterized protein n=1 Tax=Bradyrhizobium nitroreducens TaxID=709803 RepID=A0A2N9WJR5_9BRAD|nr:hypothetical protein [Bradyrhizobium nitroreducens]PIT06559.1 hypothetical protein TSA1_36615 [Bradyrhizobium nitroreducens]